MKTDRRLVEALNDLLARAFAEDGEDVTTLAVFGPRARVAGDMVCREAAVVAGTAFLPRVFAFLHPPASVEVLVEDGTAVAAGTVLARVEGPAISVLAAERTALNLVQRLTGVATATRAYVDALAGTKARLLDTRKTTPGLRALEKYAVRCGGGLNHRLALHDAVLVKDNHIAHVPDDRLGAFISALVGQARRHPLAFVQVEVDRLDQLDRLLALEPGTIDIILLDNMTPDLLAQAVARRNASNPALQLEASGGVRLDTVAAIARSGVDRISIGALTHGAVSVDVGFDAAS